MFPGLSHSETNSLQFVTNPYSFTVDSMLFMGTNGSNIKDMRMYSKGFKETPLDALEQTLRMRLIYPTCPDTLRGYPVKNDPFLISKAPRVYFAGNQPSFGHKMMDNGTVCVCVPSFRLTK